VRRCPILVEREDELQTLAAVVAGSAPPLALVTGEAGTGKSRLAHELLASLPAGWSAHSLRLTRDHAGPPALPAARPLMVALDDAHFLEPGALAALPALLDEGVAMVVTFRLGLHPAGSAEMRALAALARDRRVTELRLLPLSADGVGRMAAAMGRYATDDLHARTGGNPFWAEEILRTGIRLPWTVVETVAVQLEALAPPARELAEALAVADAPLPVGAAARLVADVDAACAALAAGGLADEENGTLRLWHALTGEAILARLGPAERARWHQRLAEALEGEAVEADRLARHWAGAGEPERAATLARAAARDLRARGAMRRAFVCFGMALRAPPADAETAAAELEQAALTAAAIGEYDAMRDWLTTAEQRYREAGRADRAARMVLDPAFDYLPVRRSGAVRDEPVERLLADALAAMADRQPDTARELVETAVDVARERGDGMALARAARLVVTCFGEFERGEALLDEALTCSGTAGEPARESRVLTIRAVMRIARGYPLEALDLLRRAVALGRQEPDAVRWPGQIALGDLLLIMGRIDEGAAMIGGAMAWGEAMVVTVDAVRRIERGDVEGGLPELVRGTDTLLTEYDFDPLGRAVTAAHILHPRALSEVHCGRPEAALLTLTRLDSLAPEPYNDVAADLVYVRAKAAVAIGDDDALADARRRIADLARVASGPGVTAVVETVRGRFAAAAALFEQAPRPVLAAELWCDAAAGAATASEAARALDRAQRICDEYELVRVAERVAGLRHVPVPSVLAALTARERDVVLLAAEGLSNRAIGARLYLAEGTVRNYLSTAFAKLGVSRRSELGRLVAPAQPVA
jgi:DNA-binding CsgD family transcriptional regulator/tetratricopeptide (TPR) repeat protein